MSNSISSFFSSFLPRVYADAPEPEPTESAVVKVEESTVEESKAGEAEEEEEEEPEDAHPAIREECKESAKCAALTKHFAHCEEKVKAGKGFHGEDCVEELCMYQRNSAAIFVLTRYDLSLLVHMMHCVDDCAAPKLFAKLK